MARPPIFAVLDDHCEELAFVRVQRRALAFSPDARLRHVAAAEGRIRAHKDALGVDPRASARAARARALRVERTTRDPFQWAAAIEIGVERDAGGELPLWEKLVRAPHDLTEAFGAALRHADRPAFERIVDRRGPFADAPRVLAAVADALAFRMGVRPSDELPGAELVDVRRARARGLSTHLEAVTDDVRRALASLVDDPDVGVRRAALWSLFLADAGRGLEVARARLDDPFAIRVLGLGGEAEDLDRVAQALAPDATRAAAIDALGELGRAEAGKLLAELTGARPPWSGRASRALDKLAGEEGAAACGAERAERQLARLRRVPAGAARVLRGAPLTDVGASSSLEALWLAAVTLPVGGATAHPALRALRREVPPAFYTGVSVDEAHPGDGPWSS